MAIEIGEQIPISGKRLNSGFNIFIRLNSNMSDIEKAFGTERGNGILNTTTSTVKKLLINVDNGKRLRKLMRLSIIYSQMKYEEYYGKIGKETDKFPRKWGDIYLDLESIFSNWICTFRHECVYDQVSVTGTKALFHVYVYHCFFHACKMKFKKNMHCLQ